MDHLTAADIDSDVGYGIPGIISTGKENDISRLCFRSADMLALVIDSLSRCPWHIVIAAVGKHITDKPRAVEAC